MEQLSEIISMIGGIVTSIALPLLGVFLFYESKKRGEAAKAKKAEAQARAAEGDNITSYAQEWKDLYEKKEARVNQLEAKIDELYKQKSEDRKRIRELTEKNMQLSLELQKANFMK